MNLIFDRQQSLLMLLNDGEQLGSWPAQNNAARSSRGPWPAGRFKAKQWVRVGGPEGELDGAYGPWFLLYDVPDRTGMGLHAGRESREDRLGRRGHEHATLGCIRTTTDAIVAIFLLTQKHGLPELQVMNDERKDGDSSTRV